MYKMTVEYEKYEKKKIEDWRNGKMKDNYKSKQCCNVLCGDVKT